MSRGRRIRLVLGYDGSGFHGFARQEGLRTVQGVLEDVLLRMLGTEIPVEGSGRTDRGVHARAQVVHFDLPYGPPVERMVHVLRRRLPADILPRAADEVDEAFHARFSVVRKTYRYTLDLAPLPSLYWYKFSWHVPEPLDLDAMKEAAKHLLGEHDFTSFCAAEAPQRDKVRRLDRVDFRRDGSRLHVEFEGNGFLQYMVRILVGTLVKVGRGKESPDRIPDILEARDRRLAGETAPPHGLCLWNVEYPSAYGGKVIDLSDDL
ncbi:tRNA pseudouridine(38-40) synthase TruA [Alicyclobacillus vulcanalis]|uniref:tRNA pseudouridine synthase A n=1 Tax=Alicyclobacillus vulcanalis TaxID=252246 RepID=A0A1N7LBD5_9BACL|nr:tRNA pseudouridine(38-40) synthase TruA [Alicyclobacillus vulcanalis]SIS71166.1 tRNA pseudouridine38-40 synthase [Alicyclobacillus vulcanalis]